MSTEQNQLTLLQIKWLAALRSGEYKQGKYALKRVRSAEEGGTVFCCLGVLCDVVDPTKWEVVANKQVMRYDGNSYESPPYSIVKDVKINLDTGTLMGVNDNEDLGFAEIADALEQYWRGERCTYSEGYKRTLTDILEEAVGRTIEITQLEGEKGND